MKALALVAALSATSAHAQLGWALTIDLGGGASMVPAVSSEAVDPAYAGPTARASWTAAVAFNPTWLAGLRFGLGFRTGQFREGWTDYRFAELVLRHTFLRRGDVALGIEGAAGLGQQRSREPNSLESSFLGYDAPILPLGIGSTLSWRPGGFVLTLAAAVESYLSTIFYPPTPPVLPGHSLPERSGGVGGDVGARLTLSIGWGST